ncbi:MAG TPA: response regulator [Candidatus Dormibacteraeota bacterium]|nr:response regulator [Candidatus Dormibacteraeota bacterium]
MSLSMISNPRKILIVEDDPTIRSMMRQMLERAGYKITEAEHGAVALQRIAQAQPDLVTTNIMMPVVDGPALIRRLRSNPDTMSLPILVVSGLPEAAEYSREANGFLVKPFVQDQLLTVVSSMIGSPDSDPR